MDHGEQVPNKGNGSDRGSHGERTHERGDGVHAPALPLLNRAEAAEALVHNLIEAGVLDRAVMPKIVAAAQALPLLEHGMTVALGSGSTASIFVKILGAAIKTGLVRDLTCVSTSEDTAALATASGIAITDLTAVGVVDIGIDGADEVGRLTRYVIKGGGGFALRERRAADRCVRFVVIAGENKLTNSGLLGERWKVPIDVAPEAVTEMRTRLTDCGAVEVSLRMREGVPRLTEDGNLILDAGFGTIPDAARLAAQLETLRPYGLKNHGLFGMATDVILASAAGSTHWVWLGGRWRTLGAELPEQRVAPERRALRQAAFEAEWRSGEPVLAPSVLDVPINDLPQACRSLEAAGVRVVHLDFCDGSPAFAPHGADTETRDWRERTGIIAECCELPFETHLMVRRPEDYLPVLFTHGASLITIHPEECRPRLPQIVDDLKNNGCRAGIAINTGTDVTKLRDLLPLVDQVLVMAIRPGRGAQAFLPAALVTLRELDALRREINPELVIAIDGGIEPGNAGVIRQHGARWIVAGSAVFRGEGTVAEHVALLNQALHQGT